MKKLLILLAFAGVFTSGLHADEAATKSSYSVTADFVYASNYIFRGLKQTDSAFQPAVTFTMDKLSLGVWTSQAVANQRQGFAQGNEVDLWGSYGVPVGKATVAVGGTAYLYPSARASLSEPDETYEASLGISGPLGPLSGSATWFHDFVLVSNTLQFGLTYGVPLPDDRGSLDFAATYGFNDINDGNGTHPGHTGATYRYYAFGATLSYKLTSAATLKLSANYSGATSVPGSSNDFWVTVGVSAGL